MIELVLFSGLAGIIGTGIGGLIGIFMGNRTKRTVSMVLTYAAGIMISISLFDLIPEAYVLSNSIITTLGVLFGVGAISLLNHILDRTTQKANIHIQTHMSLEALHHQEEILSPDHNKKKMLRAGLFMLFAIALHNFPEGMAIGASGMIDIKLGLTLAVLLTLHNIPEGMAMAVPLVAGGIKRMRTLILILLAGAITIVGGLVGVLMGSLGDNATALSVSFAAGAMLYVTFCEILPQSLLMEQGRLPAIFAIFGIITGFLITSCL